LVEEHYQTCSDTTFLNSQYKLHWVTLRGKRAIASRKKLLKSLARQQLHRLENYAIYSDVAQNLSAWIYQSLVYSFIKDTLTEFRNIKLIEEIRKSPVPKHIAVIMDGNRRFAKNIGIVSDAGHFFGRDKVEDVLNWCLELGVKNLTLYAFSTENFNRPKNEVNRLMDICRNELTNALNDERIHKDQVRVKVIGHLGSLPKDVQHAARKLMTQTKQYTRHTLTIALAYGGREEIVQAIQKIALDVKNNELDIDQINEKKVSSYLYTTGLPDPDLILRTSGEERISNFLLWQMAYSEFYFSDVYWPALTKRDFLKAIRTYQIRKRRYGR
jgi:tritrans,polycis-undecaprenyl-diphosphate synthase [geranylgeranyl-diphosphate specific]